LGQGFVYRQCGMATALCATAKAQSSAAMPFLNGKSSSVCVVIFEVRAETAFGDSLVLVGSGDALGEWDPTNKGITLTTTQDSYPLWKSAPLQVVAPGDGEFVEYKYVKLRSDGGVHWEANGDNRRLPLKLWTEIHPKQERMIMDDGVFGYIQEDSFGYPEGCIPAALEPRVRDGPRLVVIGDSVARGRGAWRLDGWANRLGRALHSQFGYGYTNVAGDMLLDGEQVRQGFAKQVAPLEPTVVVIALGSEIQRLADCPDYDRAHICKRFVSALERHAEAAWELGAVPVVAGLCPHLEFGPELTACIRQVEESIKKMGLLLLDWLRTLASPGASCSWAEGLWQEPACPNTEGHRRMFAAIDLSVFTPSRMRDLAAKRAKDLKKDQVCFSHDNGFEVHYSVARKEVIVSNQKECEYGLSTNWGELQEALEATRRERPWTLARGLYISQKTLVGAPCAVVLGESGRLEADTSVPAMCSLVWRHSSLVFAESPPLFYDGSLGVIYRKEGHIIITNEASCEYNVHPMWNDLRLATRKIPQGIYEDSSGQAFRTAVVSMHGLQSRVKVPPKSAIKLTLTGPLDSLERIAVLPLGDRCSIRMLLHKIEYDGPCYPFDLTRTTALADVSDMVASGFTDMWNEDFLWYDHDAGRVFHRKWGGLSFAHEVEDGDDPVNNFRPVAERMTKRYTGRAARFDYAAKHADRVLFIRTGCASRNEVEDVLQRIGARFPGLKSSLLLISDQPTEEFNGLEGVRHVREHFDPDRMYEDMSYWIHSAHRFRGILDGLGINARSLYWCPNNLKEAEQEVAEVARQEIEELRADLEEKPPVLTKDDREMKFSHSNLYDLSKFLPCDAVRATAIL